MRIAEVEVIPYALPFARPYVTARGTLERREMLLVRLLTDDGPVGLGEAVPLVAARRRRPRRRSSAVRKGTRRLRRADLADFAGEQPPLAAVDAFIHTVAGRRLPAPAKAAIEMAILDLAGEARGGPLWRLLGADAADAGRAATRPSSPAIRPTSRPDAERWAERGFATFKLKLGAPGTTSARWRRCARRSGPRRGSGSTRTAPGRRRGARRAEADRAARHRAGRAARRRAPPRTWPTVTGADRRSRSRPTRASRRVKDAERARRAGACDLATVKLSKVGGDRRGDRDRARLCRSTCRAPSTGRWGSPPRPTPPRRCRRRARPAGARARARDPAAVRRHDRARSSATLDGALLSVPDGPGLGVEIDEDALGRTAASSRVRSPDGPDQPQHRARLGDGRGARALRRAPRGDLPGLALDPARAGALAPAGDRGARSSSTSARPASSRSAPRRRRGTPVAILCTSGHRRRQPPPRRLRGRRVGGAADRAHRRPPAGAARDRRRADHRPAQALRRRGALVLRGRRRTTPTTPASCTSAPSPAAPSGRPPATRGPGPVHLNVPWRDPLGPEPRPGRRHGELAAGARGPRRAAR